MDGILPVVLEDRESLDGLCGEKDDLDNEMTRVKAEAAQKEEEKAKGKNSITQITFLKWTEVSCFFLNILIGFRKL